MSRTGDGRPDGQALVTRWRRQLRDDPRVGGTYMATMFALAEYANGDGTQAYPGADRLGWNVGVSERQVRRYLTRAVEEGRIAPVGTRANQYQAQVYRLLLVDPASIPPCPGAPDTDVRCSDEKTDIATDMDVRCSEVAADTDVRCSVPLQDESTGHPAQEHRTSSAGGPDTSVRTPSPYLATYLEWTTVGEQNDTLRIARDGIAMPPARDDFEPIDETEGGPTGSLTLAAADEHPESVRCPSGADHLVTDPRSERMVEDPPGSDRYGPCRSCWADAELSAWWRRRQRDIDRTQSDPALAGWSS